VATIAGKPSFPAGAATPILISTGAQPTASAPLWAGESCGLVHDIKPAVEIVRDLVREAQAAMSALNATP